ncbi:hypothetical protein D0Z00_004448 [Geotrichum galactomycetum]|uniref:Uncharacterized protein n=1 Tax=Geotrichum galactomycetum TaxID=27317 RepID=A0ACB6UYC7_9ASCO|nr:hypothetical protein D0Z00_004448 [Geotrichum candidum]
MVSKNSGNGFFNNKGAVAGVFTVVGLVALALILLVIYLIYRRRRQTDRKDLNPGFASGKGSPNSFVDRTALGGANSAAGLMPGRGRASPQSVTPGNENEKGPIYDSHTLVPIEVDQRLDPNKVYMRWENNESSRSLQDDHDYSRKVLRVTNPDDTA